MEHCHEFLQEQDIMHMFCNTQYLMIQLKSVVMSSLGNLIIIGLSRIVLEPGFDKIILCRVPLSLPWQEGCGGVE